MPRWRVPSEVRVRLEAVFWDEGAYPSRERTAELAAEFGVTPRRVKVWFQNQRQRRIPPLRSDAVEELASYLTHRYKYPAEEALDHAVVQLTMLYEEETASRPR